MFPASLPQEQEQPLAPRRHIQIMKKVQENSLRNAILLTTGILLTILGLCILLTTTHIYEFVLTNGFALHANSLTFEGWKKTHPIVVDVYFFNWTNPEDIYNETVKPRFEEVGPFRFRLVREKVNLTWNGNGTVTYRNLVRYFDDEESPRNLSEMVTTLNVVSLGLAHKSKHSGYFTKKSISMTLSLLGSISVTKSVRELMFEGYEDQILNIAGLIPFTDTIDDKFGFFYNRNNTAETEGILNMWTDVNENFGRVQFWDYQNRTQFFEGTCSKIGGSAGEFFPLHPKRDHIEIFNPELCRGAKLYYEEDVVLNGFRGLKFTGRDIFDNGTVYPENACFCTGDCTPSGVLNVSTCRPGVATFLSLPHFYGADPYFLNLIEGLRPQKEKHDFFFTLEQETAVIIDVAARLQVNMLLEPIEHITLYEDVPAVFFPVFYYEQKNTISDEYTKKLHILLLLPVIITVISIILISMGISTLVFLICTLKSTSQDDKSKSNDNTHQENLLKR